MGCENDSNPIENQEMNNQINVLYETNDQNNENQEENNGANQNQNENQDFDGAIEHTGSPSSEGNSEEQSVSNNPPVNKDNKWENKVNFKNNDNSNWSKKNLSNNKNNSGSVLNFPDSYNKDDYGDYEKYSEFRGVSNTTYLYHDSENGSKNNNNNKNGGNNNNNNKENGGNNNNNQQENFMTVGGNLKKEDIQKKINTLVIQMLGLKRTKYDDFDNIILRFHHRFGATYFFLCFFLVWFNVLAKEQIACISQTPEKEMDKHLKNICLSYSFYEMPDGMKKTVFFYRWAHTSCLVVGAAHLLLRLVIKTCETPRLHRMFSTIRKNSPRLDDQREDDQIRTFMEYFKENMGTHIGIYRKYLFNHICSFGITLLSFCFLNFVLQGEFTRLVLNAFPFEKDPVHFRDPLSIIFPPFVTCIIGPASKMLNRSEETFPCHLTLMELLEKVFVFAWVYLVSALIVGGISLLFLLYLPFHKTFLVSIREPSLLFWKLNAVLVRNLNFGDIFLLFLVKNHLTANEFCKIRIEILKFLRGNPAKKED